MRERESNESVSWSKPHPINNFVQGENIDIKKNPPLAGFLKSNTTDTGNSLLYHVVDLLHCSCHISFSFLHCCIRAR